MFKKLFKTKGWERGGAFKVVLTIAILRQRGIPNSAHVLALVGGKRCMQKENWLFWEGSELEEAAKHENAG